MCVRTVWLTVWWMGGGEHSIDGGAPTASGPAGAVVRASNGLQAAGRWEGRGGNMTKLNVNDSDRAVMHGRDPVSHPTCTALITLHHTVQPTVTVGGETDRAATTRQPKEEFESQPYGGGFGAGGRLFPDGRAVAAVHVKPTQRPSLSTHSRAGNGSEGRADQRSIVSASDDVY